MALFLARLWEAGGRLCPTASAPFEDVDPAMWAATEIDCIYGLGIAAGTGSVSFGPDDPVTRAQMAVFLARLWQT